MAFLSHRCDQGYQGTECHPEAALPSTIMSDFENQNGWESDWQEVIGGEIVKPEQGCGVISSGSSLYFSKVRAGDKGMTKVWECMIRKICDLWSSLNSEGTNMR